MLPSHSDPAAWGGNTFDMVPGSAAPTKVGVDDEAIEACLRSWLLEEALGRLSADHREVIVRTYFTGVPASEVAAALGVPVGGP